MAPFWGLTEGSFTWGIWSFGWWGEVWGDSKDRGTNSTLEGDLYLSDGVIHCFIRVLLVEKVCKGGAKIPSAINSRRCRELLCEAMTDSISQFAN
jgi:hypothetical protein